MNAFGITKKSINFFVNMFNSNRIDENCIKQYVKIEYGPNDWRWAKEQLKVENLKNIV